LQRIILIIHEPLFKMKPTLFLLLIFIETLVVSAQTNKQPYNDKQNMEVVTEREPQYPQGEQALYNFVFKNIKYSDEAKKKYIEGNVELSFDVLTDSTATNIHIISGVGYGVDEEVKKIIQKTKFSPALMMKTPVRMNVIMTFPVKAH